MVIGYFCNFVAFKNKTDVCFKGSHIGDKKNEPNLFDQALSFNNQRSVFVLVTIVITSLN